MLFRNSLKLFMENFKNVYKLLFYKAVVVIVSIYLYSALLLPQVVEIIESVAVQGLISNIKDLAFAFFEGNTEVLHGLKAQIDLSVKDVLTFISSRTLPIILSVIGCGVVYLLTRFVDTLGYFSFGEVLGDKMETYGDTPFASAYVKNLARGSAYSAIYVCTIFVYDIVVLLGCYFLFFYLLSFLSLFLSFFLSVTVIVLANALKLTLTSTWMPSMTADGFSIRQAISSWQKVQKKLRSGVFSTYVVSIYVIMVANVMFGIATFCSALILTVPSSFFFLICLQYVNYYTLTGKKYFINYEQIVTNELRGDESLAVEHIAHIAEEQFAENKAFMENTMAMEVAKTVETEEKVVTENSSSEENSEVLENNE